MKVSATFDHFIDEKIGKKLLLGDLYFANSRTPRWRYQRLCWKGNMTRPSRKHGTKSFADDKIEYCLILTSTHNSVALLSSGLAAQLTLTNSEPVDMRYGFWFHYSMSSLTPTLTLNPHVNECSIDFASLRHVNTVLLKTYITNSFLRGGRRQ